jgi:hypothetical protein
VQLIEEARDFMIKFSCENCGRKIRAPEIHAGKKGKCPKCKNIVVVPKLEDIGSLARQTTTEERASDKIAEDLRKLEESLETEQVEPEPVGERKLFWLIDIFLYPVSKGGLTNLAIFVGVPLIIKIIQLVVGPFGLVLAIPGLIMYVLIGLYICWYFAECVRDSANGGTRAPETFATADISDMYSQSLQLLGCYILFAGPVGFYYLFIHKTDTIYWFLLAYGVFFFPMGLLAAVMFNSSSAFNPIMLIGSIFRVFFQYCGFVLLIGGIVLATRALTSIQLGRVGTLTLGPLFSYVFFYIVVVVAHLLGRFYWRYQEKLNWEV